MVCITKTLVVAAIIIAPVLAAPVQADESVELDARLLGGAADTLCVLYNLKVSLSDISFRGKRSSDENLDSREPRVGRGAGALARAALRGAGRLVSHDIKYNNGAVISGIWNKIARRALDLEGRDFEEDVEARELESDLDLEARELDFDLDLDAREPQANSPATPLAASTPSRRRFGKGRRVKGLIRPLRKGGKCRGLSECRALIKQKKVARKEKRAARKALTARCVHQLFPFIIGYMGLYQQ